MIIVPDRHEQDWHKGMVERNLWRILWYYPTGTKLFSAPSATNPFDRKKRCQPIRSREVILVLVLNDEEYPDWEEYSLEKDLQNYRAHEDEQAGYSLAPAVPQRELEETAESKAESGSRKVSKNRNKQVVCEGCSKSMRSDKLKAHKLKCK